MENSVCVGVMGKMLEFIKQYSKNIYSQNGENGILNEFIKRLKILNGISVEFGAADGYYCSNTRELIERGWRGYMYDINGSGQVINKMITPENVNDLPPCGLLSIDIDGNDYAV